MRILALFALFVCIAPVRAQESPAPADSARIQVAPDPAATRDSSLPDSSIAPRSNVAADSASVPDSLAIASAIAAADSAAAIKFHPHPALESLSLFRPDWSVNYEPIPFRDPNDPAEPVGAATVAPFLRLRHAMRTRELSPVLGAESFALGGASSATSALLFDGRSISIPGTSGPHSEELVLSEISSLGILRGGAAALYGPQAASGAVVASARFPHNEELLARAFGEEGTDEYQRAYFQASRRIGRRAEFFTATESRRVKGFFPGTDQTDRYFALRVRGSLPGVWQGEVDMRRYESDEQSGGFDFAPVFPVQVRRSDLGLKFFRPWNEARGLLIETELVRHKIENLDPAALRTREISSPMLHVTADLPKWSRLETTIRGEAMHWRIESEEDAQVDRFSQAAGAIRLTGLFAEGFRLTETLRIDAEEGRSHAIQGRFEGAWRVGRMRLVGVTSRNERIPDRDAPDLDTNEIHETVLGAIEWYANGAQISFEGEATRVKDVRPEPTFEEVRLRDAPSGAPMGEGKIRRGTIAVSTDSLAIPGARVIGLFRFLTSFTARIAEIEETGARFPGWAKWTWTGDGNLENRFFRDELLLRARGRLTYLGDRVDVDGEEVVDAWVTDVLLEGEIGDAILFGRFHDMLERADEIEPGYRFPGFTYTFGLSWRFWG